MRRRCSRFGQRDELDLGAGQVAIGGNERTARRSRSSRTNASGVVDVGGQRLVDRAAGGGLSFEADAAGEIGLRVHVDEQHALLGEGERRGEVDGSRGFADAALLIGDGQNPTHYVD